MPGVRVLGAVGAAVAVALGLGAGLGAGVAPAGADTASGFRFTESEFHAAEDQPVVRVVVQRTSLPVGRSVVDYRTEPGSALDGADFQGTSGTLVFEVGATTSSFSVLVRDDDVPEDVTERLSVVLADRGTSERATVTIFDDDRSGSSSSAAPVAAVVPTTAPPAAPVMAGSGGGAAGGAPSVVAAPRAARPRAASSAPASARRRVTVRQSPVTPFELRPVGPSGVGTGSVATAVDPLVAVAAGLLLARVAAEVWFRSRTPAA